MEGMGHILGEVWDCMNTDLARSDMDIPLQVFVLGGLSSSENILSGGGHHVGHQAG